MAKKNQHIVPKAYLKRFVDSSTKKDIKKFEAGVFVNSPPLDKPWKMRGLAHRTFTETRFYNLETDDPERPIVENHLSVIEGYYDQAITGILEGQFSNEILSIISLFVSVQLFRTKKSVLNHQKSWDMVSEWADMFEGGDRNKIFYRDISKKLLLNLASNNTLAPLHKCAVIMVNSTNIPFLTSDNPVVRHFYNLEDLSNILYSQQLNAYSGDHLESSFYFMPLTPRLAYVSHNALEGKTKGFECISSDIVVQLNDLMLMNAEEYIYSCVNNPVNSMPVVENTTFSSKSLIVKAFTKSSRVIFEAKDYRRVGSLLILDLPNVYDELNLVEGTLLVYIEIFDLNFSFNIGVTGLRDCRVKTVDTVGKRIVLESCIISLGI